MSTRHFATRGNTTARRSCPPMRGTSSDARSGTACRRSRSGSCRPIRRACRPCRRARPWRAQASPVVAARSNRRSSAWMAMPARRVVAASVESGLAARPVRRMQRVRWRTRDACPSFSTSAPDRPSPSKVLDNAATKPAMPVRSWLPVVAVAAMSCGPRPTNQSRRDHAGRQAGRSDALSPPQPTLRLRTKVSEYRTPWLRSWLDRGHSMARAQWA